MWGSAQSHVCGRQIEGAVQMGLGYALSEGIIIDRGGKVKNTTFKQYHIMNAGEMPPIKVGLVEETEPTGPYGAKSIGSVRWYPQPGQLQMPWPMQSDVRCTVCR